MTEFDAGHIIAVTNGGSDNLDNLAPVCGTCNKSMGTQNLQDFKTVYFLPSSSPKDEGAPVPVSVDLLSF
jgi:5-methylcytosine-specific restriction endonuclease McrA